MQGRKYKYVDSCRTYTILLQDSGMLPKPRENWNTFMPQEKDVAFVDETRKEYVFYNNQWVELTEELGKELFDLPKELGL